MAAASMHSANSEYNLSRNNGVEVCKIRVSFFRMVTASDVSSAGNYSAPKVKHMQAGEPTRIRHRSHAEMLASQGGI